ncbi:FAD/NAD(P)-binding domain-containing protein [Parathielavia appendiculata]|uniref:FAD/NAD(P)-binding domain-containing protein n=1 Tax=Parathielavia appendiculata TaxID=2587402 RepID=A0AAN6Z1M4_9PEZI|nr:FAD/NAD(P)-binding domain-containing protein [Parathielavia appendiculata]
MTPPPRPLRVLISGAGVAGPALALHLSRLPPPLQCNITIVERRPRSRNNIGQQIDLRGQGVAAMRKLGIERAVRARLVDEPGVRMLDRRGKLQAYLASNKSGRGAQTFSAEWEIMRGDLCDVLYEACEALGEESVRFVFGTTVEGLERQPGDGKGAVRVRLSDGSEGEYDLVVGCDGIGSRVRRAMFGGGSKDGLAPVGMACALFTIPPEEGDGPAANWCHFPGRRYIMTRRDREDCLRVELGYAGDDPELKRALKHGTVAEQKEAWANIFRRDMLDAWGVRRITDGLSSPQADDFYTQEFAQVKIDRWSEGRFVLLGDAAFCPAPLTGQGTSMALIGAYVLAGEIARACGKGAQGEVVNPWDNLPVALAAYETTLRPFVKTIHDIPVRRIARFILPESAWVISFFHWAFWLFTVLRLDRLATLFMSDDTGSWKLPDYPELPAPKE